MGGASSMARASDKRLDGGVAEQCGGRKRRKVTKSLLTAMFNQQKTLISGFSLSRFFLWQSICVSHEEHMAVLNDPSIQAGTVPAADSCRVLSHLRQTFHVITCMDNLTRVPSHVLATNPLTWYFGAKHYMRSNISTPQNTHNLFQPPTAILEIEAAKKQLNSEHGDALTGKYLHMPVYIRHSHTLAHL